MDEELQDAVPQISAQELADLRQAAAEAANLKDIAAKYQAMVAAQEEATAAISKV